MSAGDGTEPISDDEIVFRRVSERSGNYDPRSSRPVLWPVFRPDKNDIHGISVWRKKYKSAAEVASIGARPDRRYFVLGLIAGSLRRAGVVLAPSPQEGGPGHCSLVNMNYGAYCENKNRVRELANTIVELLIEDVEGPFGPFNPE